jgi:hypothetical protein
LIQRQEKKKKEKKKNKKNKPRLGINLNATLGQLVRGLGAREERPRYL